MVSTRPRTGAFATRASIELSQLRRPWTIGADDDVGAEARPRLAGERLAHGLDDGAQHDDRADADGDADEEEQQPAP